MRLAKKTKKKTVDWDAIHVVFIPSSQITKNPNNLTANLSKDERICQIIHISASILSKEY